MSSVRDKTVRLGEHAVTGLWLAPMAGYTDVAFRKLAKEYGAALTVTEMVSVRGLVRGNEATEFLLKTTDIEKPSCVQLFGNNPEEFFRAAKILDCDVIDINMGCPMPKIVKNGDGSALLDSPSLAGDIVRATIDGSGKPVTVKTRLGRRMGELTADKLIECVEKAGAAAVTLHGRYAEQRYAGVSDRAACAEIAKRHGVPIVYNGDICAEDINGDFDCFGAVAVGRAALSDIGIFSGVSANPFDVAIRHIELLKKHFDGRYAVNQARKFFVHYFKSMRGGKSIRAAVNSATCPDEVIDILLESRQKICL
ncbi:MAG: tRNA-dihydrouridine synthase family protein [Clostridiales bacterium]|nr:tRNA-dihydrouridine synthase family protein [Clostridiales bacterium]